MEGFSAPSTPSKAAAEPFAWTPNRAAAVAEAYLAAAPRRTGATYAETLDAFTNFLTAYIHTLLYLRTLYPKTSFVHSRFHNTSAYQSRHPLVCDWIHDAIEAVREELFQGTISRIGIVIFSYENGYKTGSGGSGDSKGTGDVQIMERFMIDVSAFPVVDRDNMNAVVEWETSGSLSHVSSPEDKDEIEDDEDTGEGGEQREGRRLMFDEGDDDEEEEEEEHEYEGELAGADESEAAQDEAYEGEHEAEHKNGGGGEERHLDVEDGIDRSPPFDIAINTNLAEQMRAALISLTTRCSTLKPLPPKCSFNICMELKDEADIDPPIEHPQAWIPVQPSLQKTGRATVMPGEGGKRKRGEDLGGVRVTPIRTVETGTFRFETWVEEGRAKFESTGSQVKFGDAEGKTKPVTKETPKTPAKGILKNKETPAKAQVSFSSSGDTIIK